jgi:hypothetical protein
MRYQPFREVAMGHELDASVDKTVESRRRHILARSELQASDESSTASTGS